MSELAYRVSRPDGHSKELGEKILRVMLESGVTYGQAFDALSVAGELLEKRTQPVSFPHQGD